ncbi:MFS multidrug transporter-like protein, partial [Hypoxylon sp. EC38]
LASWRLATVIGSLCLGVFLFGLDVNIIAVAIPPITTEFRSLQDVAWYGSAYMLTLTAFQPLFGNLYKYFNAKVVYITSLAVFELGSTICAAAPTSAVLIFGRAWLGLGAAGLLQGALAIIGQTVTIDKVPLYQGIVLSAMAVAVCCGPVIGGALTQYVTWHWCFWINLPAGVCVIIIVLLFVPFGQPSKETNLSLPLREKLRHMDAPGLVLFLGAVTCILLALTWGGSVYHWNDREVIGLFVGFGTLSICFFCWLVRQGELALIPVRVLKKRSVYVGATTLIGFGIISVVYGYYLPILFQSAQGASTTESGLRYIALVGPQLVALIIVGAVVSRWGYYVPYMISGGIICCVGAGLLTTIDLSTPTTHWATYLAITGIGLGISGQLPYTAIQAVLDPADVPTGNAINVFSFHLAGAVGTAIGQALLIDGLNVAVPRYTDAVTPAAVIQAGATGLNTVATSPMVLEAIRSAYVEAVRRTIILGLAGICMTVPVSCAMEWVNIKHVAERRCIQESEHLPVGNEETKASTEKLEGSSE